MKRMHLEGLDKNEKNEQTDAGLPCILYPAGKMKVDGMNATQLERLNIKLNEKETSQ